MKAIVTVAVAVVCSGLLQTAAVHAAAAWEPPWFCHDLDCPRFKLVANRTDIGIEHRRYEAGKWASTTVTSKRYEQAVATGFWRLFKYISGANAASQKIPMTAPVITKVEPSKGPFCEDSFTISFFVPFDFQADPPAPTDDTVSLAGLGPMEVYVSGFGGFATGATFLDRAAEAAKALDGAELKYATDYFFTAGYDSPFRLRNRHNEVWLLVDDGAPSGGALRLGGGQRAARGCGGKGSASSWES